MGIIYQKEIVKSKVHLEDATPSLSQRKNSSVELTRPMAANGLAEAGRTSCARAKGKSTSIEAEERADTGLSS